VPLVGRLVRSGDPASVPFAWLDDVSYPGDDLQARARVIQPGATRVEVRDTGARPCAASRLIAAGTPDPSGLTTLVVRLPRACQDPPKIGESLIGYSRIQAIAFDSAGAEIGRSPVALSTDYDLPDAP